jgi:hypothetical protein
MFTRHNTHISIWHNLFSELTGYMKHIFSQYKQQVTNRPQVITNQTDPR